ncbi:hypothetical protein BC937DRAFT_88225 [Endogone sp. FLAS-F59071]|nr:hypothetical protein BC937DRAFT_88225 [Endogone sp. FLAS-F59071]|eukprot:RUS22619.1 hypothetical protein BC937DRAFT_88225 [Endogone sp. FLAS-F59071]
MLTVPSNIVLATNIAESSITVPDIQIVFDSCLRKDVHYDTGSRCFSLNEAWVSKDCGEQRKGRAGRTGPGVIYRFVPRAFYDSLPSERTPEILRTPLDSLLLRCIDARLGDPKEILSRCIDPPENESVDVAFEDLVGIGAVVIREVAAPADDEDEMWVRSKAVVYEYEVTMLGRVLARLPLDLYAGLLVIYGVLYGQLHEAMIMAGMRSSFTLNLQYLYAVVIEIALFLVPILQNKGIIVQPAGQDISITATLKRFHVNFPTDQPIRGGSDLISHLRAYLYWEETTQNNPCFDLATELQWCQAQYLSLYWIREVQDLILTVKESLSRHGICAPPTKTERNRIRSNRVVRVRPAMLDVGPDALDNTEQVRCDVYGEDAPKEEQCKAVGFTEYDEMSIRNAIEILDKAAGENSTVSSTPGFSTSESIAIQPVATTGFTKSLQSTHYSGVNELSAETRSVLNPWMNMFDRSHNITAQTVQLQREPNTLCLALLLTAAFHHNILLVTSSNGSLDFCNCPLEFDRRHTIEFTAMHLPPKDVMVKALQREIGFIAKIDYVNSDEPGVEDACYVEFIKPAKLIWDHSRDYKDDLPDALYIAQKMKIARNATWDNLTDHNTTSQQHPRFLSISGDPRTATKLMPIFSSSQTRTFLPRSSLFFPIISPKYHHHRYTISAARLLAVDRGRSWVAEYATCLIGPLPSSKSITNDDSNIGDLIIALLGNDVNMSDGWSISVRGQSYSLFDYTLPPAVERVLMAVRSYNHRALFEWFLLLPEITAVNAFDEVNVSGIQSLTDVARAWETMKLKPHVAGDLLVKTVLMSL